MDIDKKNEYEFCAGLWKNVKKFKNTILCLNVWEEILHD